jgi:hypothetical protein
MANSGFLKMSIDMHALKNNLEENTMAASKKHNLPDSSIDLLETTVHANAYTTDVKKKKKSH